MAKNFNPRSPHGERRKPKTRKQKKDDFNPRSPHGERHRGFIVRRIRECISIHAPRTGSDVLDSSDGAGMLYFNPRSPHGERPPGKKDHMIYKKISIHAPRTGSDER